MDFEVKGGLEIPRTNGFARRAEWILGDFGALFIFKCEIFELERFW